LLGEIPTIVSGRHGAIIVASAVLHRMRILQRSLVVSAPGGTVSS